MRFAIAYSKKDPAGVNIITQLKTIGFLPQVPIIELNKETIYAENLNEKTYPQLKNIEFIVFASKHASEKGEKSLCLHAPGNWRNADFGGQSTKICQTSSYVMKYLFKELEKNIKESKLTKESKLNPPQDSKSNNRSNNLQDYNLTLEVTHHGPLIDIPCCFIEVGSGEEAWNNKEAGTVIAKTILSLQNFNKKDYNNTWIPCIGIGGPHYAPNFNKIQLESNYAIGHIIPSYSLPINQTMLQQAEEKTTEQIKEVLVDWKGCGKSEDRQKIVDIINQFGLKYKRTGNVGK